MSNLVVLNNVDHHDLRVAIRHGAAFGDAVNQVLIFPTEFEQAQREYPIVFRRDERGDFYAVVLLGLDPDENLFLDDAGWQARYVPAIQRRGPFIARAGDVHGDGDPEIAVDLDDARVGTTKGEALYLPQGGTAPYLEHVAAILDTIRRGHEAMPPLFAALAEADLIQPVSMTIALDDGDSYVVPDIFTVSQDGVAALEGPTLNRLHRSGVLRAAIMASSSLENVNRLIELKTRKIAMAR